LHGGEVTLRAHHLPERIGDARAVAPSVPADPSARRGPEPERTAVAESVELPALMVALRTSGGNVARAAAMLGISRQRAYRLMEGQAVDLEALRKQEERGG
jgi:DNA-binding NtrC family response regulator